MSLSPILLKNHTDIFESELDTNETSVEQELLALLIKGVAGDELTNVCFSLQTPLPLPFSFLPPFRAPRAPPLLLASSFRTPHV